MDNLKTIAKILIQSEDKKGSYGPGIDRLLKEVKKSGSLNKASKNMNMSYSKAWKLVNQTEEMLGFDLIERHAGAKGSDLTKEAKEIIEYYEELNEEVRRAVAKVDAKFKKDQA